MGSLKDLNKFSLLNTPSLYDETILKKQLIQYDYLGMGVKIFLCLFVVGVVLIHITRCSKPITKFIVRADFLLITGGDRKSFSGGLIFMLYVLTMVLVVSGLVNEQLHLNEWIDSSQLAP